MIYANNNEKTAQGFAEAMGVKLVSVTVTPEHHYLAAQYQFKAPRAITPRVLENALKKVEWELYREQRPVAEFSSARPPFVFVMDVNRADGFGFTIEQPDSFRANHIKELLQKYVAPLFAEKDAAAEAGAKRKPRQKRSNYTLTASTASRTSGSEWGLS